MTRYVVRAWIGTVGPILCARPYPRSDDPMEPFSYPTREEAEDFAAVMRKRFPENQYDVEED